MGVGANTAAQKAWAEDQEHSGFGILPQEAEASLPPFTITHARIPSNDSPLVTSCLDACLLGVPCPGEESRHPLAGAGAVYTEVAAIPHNWIQLPTFYGE